MHSTNVVKYLYFKVYHRLCISAYLGILTITAVLIKHLTTKGYLRQVVTMNAVQTVTVPFTGLALWLVNNVCHNCDSDDDTVTTDKLSEPKFDDSESMILP